MVTAEVVKATLADSHRENDYGVTVPLELLEEAKNHAPMFMIFMGIIAAISLVVGGIGIMNIMPAMVTERMREIGIRRALGAKRQYIARQFLVETVVLSIVGGMTGVFGGLTCRPMTGVLRSIVGVFPKAIENLPEVIRDAQPEIVGWSIPLAFGISVGVGVVFGLYPGLRAAAMDPIEALRRAVTQNCANSPFSPRCYRPEIFYRGRAGLRPAVRWLHELFGSPDFCARYGRLQSTLQPINCANKIIANATRASTFDGTFGATAAEQTRPEWSWPIFNSAVADFDLSE